MSVRKGNLLYVLVPMLLALFTLSSSAFATLPRLEVEPLENVPQDDPFFGIVQAIHDPDKAVAAGARWERLVVWWSNFQPDGPEDWVEDAWFARNLIDYQKGRNIEPVGVILHTPHWAATDSGYQFISPPRNLDLPYDDPENYWGQFTARLAEEYAGTVDTWILWNEPDIYQERFANWAGSVEEFAQMQMVGYQAIKDANPKAKVFLTGTTYWWDVERERELYLKRLLSALIALPDAERHGGYFDGVAVHQYNSPLNNYIVPVLYRRLLKEYDLNKRLWVVESNAVPHDDPFYPLHRGGLRVSMEEQANYIIQSIALARAAGVERYSVYKMRDEEAENDQHYGLVRNDSSVRPAYVAYQTAVRELSNTRNAQYFWNGSASPPTEDELTALLASSREQPQFVWPGALNGVRMIRGRDRVTVLWNVTAAPLQIGIPSSTSEAYTINKYGDKRLLTRRSDDSYRLTLDAATHNTDNRNESLIMTGGDPLILVEVGAARARDPYPRLIDACWDVPGAGVPPNPTIEEAWVAPTGYAVGGPWLHFLRTNGDIDNLGYPRSPVVPDPLDPEECVQYFQRVVLEWHPDDPPEEQIKRRLLTQEWLHPIPAPASPPEGDNHGDYWYFPEGANGFGHAVSNYDPDGGRTWFKQYFDENGMERAFGYPMAPPSLEKGEDGVKRWSQRFQAAIFEYYPEFDIAGDKPGTDIPWRTWRIQLRLLGDDYLKAKELPFIVGDPAERPLLLPEPTP